MSTMNMRLLVGVAIGVAATLAYQKYSAGR